MKIINSETELIKYVEEESYFLSDKKLLSAIVVEGYDGVGKGRVLDILSERFNITPYRPDYNLWQKYDHRAEDRWKVSGFFWDVYSHFKQIDPNRILLFDRGVISGAVYNHDIRIAEDYKKLLRDNRVLHILVSCDMNSFIEFQKLRNPEITRFELGYKWCNYERYYEEYLRCLDVSGVEYVVYNNKFNEEFAKESEKFCIGCGHYSYGYCRHPDKNEEVDPHNQRCLLSYDKETQDMEV